MKKILSLLTLALFSVMSWAASIGAPTSIDFGSHNLYGLSYVMDSVELTLSPSGISGYGISVEVIEDAEGIFSTSHTWLYANGKSDWNGTKNAKVYFTAAQTGTFTAKLRLTDYGDVQEDVQLKVVVTNDLPRTIPFERIESTSGLKSGDTIIFVCESASEACGPLDGAALSAVSVTLNNGKADIPEDGLQMFRAVTYSGGWQFYTADANEKRLHLDIVSNNAKGAFTYADAAAGKILATWGVAITNGNAVVSRPDETYPVRWSSGSGLTGRFKPYLNSTGSDIAIYKKVGSSVEIKSKLEVDAIDFGTVELSEAKEVAINYTGEHLTANIEWDITGPDAALFSVTPTTSTDRESGSVTVKYLGTATSVKAVSAKLYALTQDAAFADLEKEIPISITLTDNTIKLTKIEFSGAPTTIDQGQTIDLSSYVVYTPGNAEDKSLTWSVTNTYQGEVDQDGKITAKHVTGTIVVTITSVRVPSVTASHTLTITKPTITDFTLSDTEVTLKIGETKQLSITAYVPEYAIESATYSSNDTKIATVTSSKGLITAKAIGDAEITAKIGDVEKKCTVHVVATPVESITLPSEANLTLGSTLQLNPTILPAQAATDHASELTYESKNESVATVSESGLVTSKAVGDAVIVAKIDGKEAQMTIHVVAAKTFAKVTDASSLKANDTIILATIYEESPIVAGPRGTDSNGKKKLNLATEPTVSATEAYADDACRMVLDTVKGNAGFTLTIVGGKTIAVASSGNDIQDANTQNCKFWEFLADGSNGIFIRNLGNTNAMFKYLKSSSAVKPYKSTTAGAVYVYVYVRKYVAPAPSSISLNKTTLDMQVGDQNVKLKATIKPDAASQEVTWSSSDESVATVDAYGWVHAVAEGTATITAKSKENEALSATCEVTVKPEQGTGLDTINEGAEAKKIVREGQIMILRGDRVYTITGQEIR